MKTARETLEIAAYEAQTAVLAAQAARKAAKTLQPPDGRSPASEMCRQLAGEEQSSLARLSPRRSRWPDLLKFDEQVASLETRRRTLADERATLTEQL